MRIAIKLLLAAAISALLLLIGFLAYLAWGLRTLPPDSELPDLVRNLPSKDADKAFHERVGKIYPDGTPIQNLAAELKRAGFSLHETIIVRAGVPLATFDYASLEQQGGLCMTRWSISWYPDQDDRARKLHGNYSRECL